MNSFIRFLITIWLLLGFISCHSHEGNKKTSMQQLRSKVPISYLPGELDSLYKTLYRGSFILQEKHDEFRHPVEQQFPMKQRLAHDTWILERTSAFFFPIAPYSVCAVCVANPLLSNHHSLPMLPMCLR